jgi:hypothetical protein
MHTIEIDEIVKLEKTATPAPGIVRLFSHSGGPMEMDRAEADRLAKLIADRTGLASKVKAKLGAEDDLTVDCATTAGAVKLRFTHHAAIQFVAQMRVSGQAPQWG